MTDFTIKIKISKKDFLLLSLFVSFSHNSIKVTTIVGLIATIFSIFKIIGQESLDSIAWDRVIKVKNIKNCLIIFTGIHTAKLINKKYLSEEQKEFIIQKGN